MKRIPIFFSFDDNYVVPASVAFYSLLQKSKIGIFYEMHVLHSNITQEHQRFLCEMVNRTHKGELTFISSQGFLADEWQSGNWDGHNQKCQFTVDTILPCFAASFFPQYDKIIYSDVDVVVMDDISDLYAEELADNYVLGVRNLLGKYNKYELSHLSPEHYEQLKDSYIASGIWLLNLKKIRQENLEQRLMEIVKDNSITKRWPDQDVMNIASVGKVGFLPLNYISYPYLLDYLNKKGFVSHFSREELYDSLLNPKILHYAGDKPWNSEACQKADIWFEYFYYLRLHEAFPNFCDRPQNKWKRKYRKYRTLFWRALIFSGCLLLALVLTLLFG